MMLFLLCAFVPEVVGFTRHCLEGAASQGFLYRSVISSDCEKSDAERCPEHGEGSVHQKQILRSARDHSPRRVKISPFGRDDILIRERSTRFKAKSIEELRACF